MSRHKAVSCYTAYRYLQWHGF